MTHLAIGGGKDGNLYVFNRDALGGFGDGNAWQELSVGTEVFIGTHGVIFGTGAMWNDHYYLAGAAGPLQAFQLDPSTAKLSLAATSSSPSGGHPFPGATPAFVVGAVEGSDFDSAVAHRFSSLKAWVH